MRIFLGSLATIFIWVIVLLPTWTFLGARILVNPEGFWQNTVFFGLGFWILGTIQFVLIAFGLAITFLVWTYLYE